MKRLLSLLLSLSLMVTIVSGCTAPVPTELPASSVQPNVIESVAPTVPDTTPGPTPIPDTNYHAFVDLSDPALLSYVEDSMYSALEFQFASDDYIIEDVAACYISKEYLEELAYNSQESIYFGYTLSDLDRQFDGNRYIFTLDEDGNTIVQKLDILQDNTVEAITKNITIGTGIILVCVTVSVASAGLGAPAAISAVFAASAKTGVAFALSGGVLSAAMHGIVTGYQTGDVNESIRAAALSGSEGFKWGAFSGAIFGGASKAIKFQRIIGTSKVPTPRAAEEMAREVYGGKEQVTFLAQKEVPYGTPGATRPDLVRMHHGHYEAIEVKNYDLLSATSRSELFHELKRQISARILNLPEGYTQRIVLNIKGRNYPKGLVKDVIAHIRADMENIYPNIPINIMR